MKVYSVKEAYVTLQGEGAQTGRAAVFLRFAGCNLWSGLERDRAKAVCNFCDTDFVGTDGENGGKFEGPEALAQHVRRVWNEGAPSGGQPYVICTGGEPLLQLDPEVISALKAAGFEIGVETNGTIEAPDGLDWICVSPKGGSDALEWDGVFGDRPADWLRTKANSIEGGTSEVMLEILSKRVLELPAR